MFSDTYKIKLVDDVIYEVYGRVRFVIVSFCKALFRMWFKILRPDQFAFLSWSPVSLAVLRLLALIHLPRKPMRVLTKW